MKLKKQKTINKNLNDQQNKSGKRGFLQNYKITRMLIAH